MYPGRACLVRPRRKSEIGGWWIYTLPALAAAVTIGAVTNRAVGRKDDAAGVLGLARRQQSGRHLRRMALTSRNDE